MVGVGIAFFSIEGLKFATRTKLSSEVAVMKEKNIQETAGEEDPTFVSKFSRGFIYSSSQVPETPEEIAGKVPADYITGISALAYSVTNLERESVVIEKDADRLLPVASITKLVTAVVAKKLFDKSKQISITVRMLSTEGDTGRLRFGEKYKIGEILYPLLMVSSNDAAEAIAQSYDTLNGRGKFVKEMNAWANSIGAYRTYFKDASGLSFNNLSTANDISIIAKWIKVNEPEIFDITLTKAKTIRTHTWINPTHFLNISSYQGGKNGYTTEANRTSVSLFYLGFPKRLYSVVLLGSMQRDADTLAVLNEVLK